MKKLIIIYALLLFGSMNAQFIKYGVTANFHNGSIAGIHNASKPNFGGSIGVFADFSLVPNDIYDSSWLYFTPQLEFSTQGERASWDESNDLQKYSNYYVAIPLYIKYFLKNHGYKGDLYFMLGPKFEFLAYDKADELGGIIESTFAGYDPAKFGLGEKITKFGYGVSVGVGVKVEEKWDVFLRFDRGLSKVYPDYSKHPTYNRFLGIGVNYYIGETN